MLITKSWVVDLLILTTTVLFLVYKYLTRNFNYWKNRGIYYIPPVPLFGNAFDLMTFKRSAGNFYKDIYEKTDKPFFGIFIFDAPYLVVKSPELIKRILVKDFNYFTDRTVHAPKHNELFANLMFFQKSPDWKKTRPKLTPIFTSAKLRGMCDLSQNSGKNLVEYLRTNIDKQQEAKEVCAKYATDVIAKCAFAIEAGSFLNEDAVFRKVGRAFFEFRWMNAIRQSAFFFLQDFVKLFHIEFVDKWVNQYLIDLFWQAIKIREQANVKGNDLIDIILDMRKNKELCEEIKFEGDKVVAQAVMFFIAGFETTSATMAFTLYELAVNPDIQEKLRAEVIQSIKENNGITYDSLQEMKYLDMCVYETLRKYPAVTFLDRRCNEDYKIPGTDFVIEKGLPIFVPLMGLHYDEKYFPEPNKYDPERFSDKNSHNVDGLRFLPFGEGPRSCIGERFGSFATKLGLAYIVSEFIIEKSEKTSVPIEFESKSIVLAAKGGMPLRFRELGKKN